MRPPHHHGGFCVLNLPMIRRITPHPFRLYIPILGTRAISPLSAHSHTHSRCSSQPISGTCRTILIDTLSPPHYTHDQTLLPSDPAVPSRGHRHATHHPHAHRHPRREHPFGTPCRRHAAGGMKKHGHCLQARRWYEHVALLSPSIASRATTRDQEGNMPIDASLRLHYGIGNHGIVLYDVPRLRRPRSVEMQTTASCAYPKPRQRPDLQPQPRFLVRPRLLTRT